MATCFAPNQLDMLALLSPETIAIEAQIQADKAARDAERRELIEATLEARKIEIAIAARRKDRTCLSCRGSFRSEGPGHRICSPCKGLDAWTSPNEFSVAVSASF